MLRVALAQFNPIVGDLDGNVARMSTPTSGRGRRVRHRGLPRAVDHRLSARGPGAQAAASSPTTSRRWPSWPRTPAAAPPSSASSTPDRDLYNAAAVCAERRGRSARIASGCCPTTPCSTRLATSRRANETDPLELYVIGGVKVGISICEDIWSPDGPLAEQAAGGAELNVNINGSPYHLGKAADRERMLATRAADAQLRARVRQPGRRPGRAGLRRRLDGVRRRGHAARPRPPSSSRSCSSSTCRSRRSTASGCSTRVAGSAPSRAADGRVTTGLARREPAAVAIVAEPLDPIGELYEALVLGTRRLRAQERLQRRGDRAVGWHRLHARGVHRRRRARRRARARRVDAVAVLERRLQVRRRPARREPGHRLPHDRRSSRAFAAYLDMLAPSFEGRRRTSPRRTSRAGAAADADGAVEQVRLDGAHHRQQERDGRRLLHPLRRLGRWVRRHQGRAQDPGVRPVPLRQPGAPGARSSPRASSQSRRRPSCGPTSATTRACRRTRCSTRSSSCTSRTTAPPARSSSSAHDEAVVRRITRLVDITEYKRRQCPPGVRVSAKAFGKDRRLPITNGYRGLTARGIGRRRVERSRSAVAAAR